MIPKSGQRFSEEIMLKLQSLPPVRTRRTIKSRMIAPIAE
jgi:hypothetical protein